MKNLEQTRVCKKCGQERSIEKFPITKMLTRGNICMNCIYAREKEKLDNKGKFWLEDWIYLY